MKINIYHTNDIHANITFLQKIEHYLRNHKKENDLYFDSGDFADLKSILIQADKGYSAFTLLKNTGLDAMTLGNGEIDLSYDAIKKIGTLLPLIGTNITDNDDNPIENVISSTIIERLNKRFLILGISPFYTKGLRPNGYNVFSMMGNVKFHEPIDLVRKELEINKGNYDYCILLSHSGYENDLKLLEKWPEIDLCLGGHCHQVVNHKGYSESGKGEFLGKITLEINEDKIEEIDTIQIDLKNESINDDFKKACDEKEKKAIEILSTELNVIDELKLDYYHESSLTNFICDALLKEMGGDFAFINAGICEGDLIRPVSKRSLLELSPSKLNPTKFPLLGKDFLQAVILSFDMDFISQEGKAPGYRGHILGTLGYSKNVRINSKTKEVFINELPLELEKEYMVVSNDYLQRGSYYKTLKTSNDASKFHKWFIRDLIENYLEDKELFESSKIKRIKEN